MSERIFEADTVAAALEKAARELDTKQEELEHRVIEERTKDFWGLDDRFVRVQVWVAGQLPTPTPEPEEEDESQEAAMEADGEAGGAPLEASGEAGPTTTAAPLAEGYPPAQTKVPEGVAGQGSGAGGGAEMAGSSPGAAAAAEDGDSEMLSDPEGEIEGLLERIFQEMSFDCSVALQLEADAYSVLVNGQDKDLLLEGQGRALSALELILNHAFRHRLPEGKKIRVDAGDFRSRREEELRDLAFQVAHSAKQSGSTQETQPLNPYERRLVHLALADDAEVTTRSRGSGFLKNVQVIPRGGGRVYR
ncbi:MAG: protein jag [Acidobacteriota bacterium]